jgi:hypothetical protein
MPAFDSGDTGSIPVEATNHNQRTTAEWWNSRHARLKNGCSQEREGANPSSATIYSINESRSAQITFTAVPRPSGEIGKRAMSRASYPSGFAGSSPALATNATLVQRQNASMPRWRHGFDSRELLHCREIWETRQKRGSGRTGWPV